MIAGWSSLVARRAHNPEVGGSNPSPATIKTRQFDGFFYLTLISTLPFNVSNANKFLILA